MFSTSICMTALLGLASFTTALPKDGLNYELYTNRLGYTTSRFKSGLEPGTADYPRRFGSDAHNLTMDLGHNDSHFMKRAGGRSTEPFIGRQKIPFGSCSHSPAILCRAIMLTAFRL